MSDIKNYRGGSQKTLNEINISVVLDRIRGGDNVSRSSLSKELNLSFPTVSRIVETLIEKKYIYEVGPGKSSGGKRPMILRFNAERSYVIGIGADVNFINVLLSDLCGNEIKTIYESFPKYKKPNEMIDIIVGYINRINSELTITGKEVAVISIGIPATISDFKQL
jgi:DNA-binding Lrp family transcriptional regulator